MKETMKNFRYSFCRFLALTTLLIVVSACVEPLRGSKTDGNEDLYTISFRVATQDDGVLTKAGPLSGSDYVFSKLFMYCFDANGRYLGRYAANLVSTEPLSYTESQTPGQFKGEIPPATSRIHFVAGADRPVGNDYIGMTETEVMHTPGLVYSGTTDPIAYWGYLRRSTPNEIKELFDEEITDQTVTIWMVRDRLWIEAGSFNNTSTGFYNATEAASLGNDNIEGVKWVVYGGLNRGYIATFGLPVPENFDTTADNPFETYTLNQDNPYQELRHVWVQNPAKFAVSSVVTPYPDVDKSSRFETTEADMVPFEKTVNGYMPMYLFDDACTKNVSRPAHVSRIIIKATFKATGKTKYFPICISHGYASEPVDLMRGHRYILNLANLPEASGYGSFDDAAKATTFANGALVDVPDEVVEVSDGQFDMRINYVMKYPLSGETYTSTAILLHKTTTADATTATSGSLAVPFYVGKQSTSVGDQTFYFQESSWLDPDDETITITPAHTDGNVTWGSGITVSTESTNADIGSNLNTTVTLPMATVENDELKQSTYNLKAYYIDKVSASIDQKVHHILMRNIDVYTIDQFRIQEAYTKSTQGGDGHNADGTLELTRNTDGTYSLKFKIPGGTDATGDHDKYPDLLYPLQIKLATRTLQPYDIHFSGQNTSNPVVFGVQVRSTQPGTEPAYLTAPTGQNAASQWNYQETNKYWNFWYTYSITSAPSNPEITIDLKDVRNASTFSTIPSNVGLFLYIEFFGKASAVSYNVAHVPVTSVTVNPASGTSTQGHATNNRYQIPRSTNNSTSTLQLKATVLPDNATYKNVKWESSNTSRATVDANGLVTLGTSGNVDVNITATTVDKNNSGNTVSNTFYLRVTNN